MTTFEKLYRLYESYEQFSYDYLLSLAKEKAEYIFRMMRSTDGTDTASKYLLAFSALLAACNLNISEKSYDFFVAATGINLFSYEQFKQFAKKISGEFEVRMMFRETANEKNFTSEFDNSLFIYALAFTACDGKINDSERRFILENVPFGDI